MSLFLSAFHLVLRRSLANWKLLSCVIIGVVVAVALVSSTPLYSNTLSDLGLSRSLNEKSIELINVQVYAPSYPINIDEYQRNWGVIRNQVSRNIGSVVRQEEQYIKTQTFYAGWADRPIPTDPNRPKGHFQVFTNMDKHINLIDGRYPEPFPAGLEPEELLEPGLEIEAMIGSTAAELFDVWVGDRLVLLYGWGKYPVRLTVRLTGIIDPIDPEEEFWFLNSDLFALQGDSGEIEGPTAPLFIPEQTLFEGIGRLVPNLKATYHWYYYLDTNKITSANAAAIKRGVQRMESQIIADLPRSSAFTQLNSIITTYEQKLLFTQIPLFLLIFQIVGIILYYVVTVANMVIDQQAGEIALLRSRGASTGQIMGIYFMEGLMISALGGVVGPFLGALVFTLLGKTAPFLPLTGGGLLEIRFSSMVFILAAVSAVLCLIAMLFPAMRAARMGVVSQRQNIARPPRAPFWQRYYLDIMLLVVGGILFWELRERGTLTSQNFFGEVGIDPLLLVTPILFMIAAAIIFLRLFPLIIALAARIGRYTSNTAVVLSLRYMARNPMHYGRLILLLMMAASVGMFSASFLGTLERSYDERAMYTTGSDIRLSGIYDYRSGKEAIVDKYTEVPGVEEVSVGFRGNGVMGSLFTQIDLSILAVDPVTLAEVGWFREDFASSSLTELMDILAEDQPIENGLPLPDGTETIGVWVYPLQTHPGLLLTARIQDGKGHYIDYELGIPGTEEWHYLEVDLFRPLYDTVPPPPLTLQCIFARIKKVDFQYRDSPRTVYLDNLQVGGSFSAEPVVVEDFEDVSGWVTVADEAAGGSAAGMPTTRDTIATSTEVVHDGVTSGKLTWEQTRSFGYRGLYPHLDIRPLSIIASQSLLDRTGISVGDLVTFRLPGQFIPVIVEEVIDYFPTVDPDVKGFALANIDRITAIRNLTLSGNVHFYPNEVWLTATKDPEQRETVIETLTSPGYRAREFYDQEAMIAKSRSDPLVAAGWGGILLIAFLGIILVSGLGFVVYAYLSARGRQLEFAILRTLGFSLRQIIGLICLEQVFVIGSGMGIGTLLGMQLSSVMMPFLQLTEMGHKVLPPFVPVTDWFTIGIAYIILAVAFIVTISLVILFFSKVAIHRALRIGE